MGGVLLGRLGTRQHSDSDLVLLLGALALGHGALALTTGSVYTLGLLLFIAGAAIAPTYSTVYAIVSDVAPGNTMTEAFAWLGTAVAVGGAIGAATPGALVQAPVHPRPSPSPARPGSGTRRGYPAPGTRPAESAVSALG